MSKFYITTPIYYVNAKPHIGHAYTTLAADVIARYQKQHKEETQVFFLTGTDEHGAKVAEAAKQSKKNPKAFTDEISEEFKKAWEALGINYTHFIRTTDDCHKKSAGKFLTKLKEKKALYQSNYTGLYCTGCESFITESQLNDKRECPDHKKKPEQITEKNWFFKLSDYANKVKSLIDSNQLEIAPKVRKIEVLGLFKQGMEDFSVSRPNVKWGIPLSWDSNQTIYVWVEALLNYWTAVYDQRDRKHFWPPDLQLMAKDIIKFHCIYWPAMLLAYFDNNSSKLPKKIFAHGFFTVDNQKMSKTLGNVIDPVNLTKEYGVDAARYLILSQFPFGNDGDIEACRFIEKYNADLANGIGNVVARVTMLCEKKIVDWDNFWTDVQNQKSKITNQKIDNLMQNLQLFEALKYINEQITKIDALLAKEKPWKLDKEKNQSKIIKVLAESISRISAIGEMLEPFLPKTSKKIKERISIKEKKIEIGESLFPRK